ncbi:MAG: hypothetical protein ACLP1X_25825 [Polyangiaceae bacterium]|jgi:hypothetical protein
MLHGRPAHMALPLLAAIACGGQLHASADGAADDASAAASGADTSADTSAGTATGTSGDATTAGGGEGSDDAGDAETPAAGDGSAASSCAPYLVDGGIHPSCFGGDCPAGLVCCGCFSLPEVAATSLCALPSCVTGNVQLCASDSECLTGTCQTVVENIRLCMLPPDAGDASGVDGGEDAGEGMCPAPSSGPCAGQVAMCATGPCGGTCYCSQTGWICAPAVCPH